jgi:hypothetical protein
LDFISFGWWGLGTHSDSFTSEFSSNFNLKNMISTYTKDFLRKHPVCSQEYRGLCFFSTLLSTMWPNLAKTISERWPLWLRYRILKRNPAAGEVRDNIERRATSPSSFSFNVSWIIGWSEMVVKSDKFFFQFSDIPSLANIPKRIEH